MLKLCQVICQFSSTPLFRSCASRMTSGGFQSFATKTKHKCCPLTVRITVNYPSKLAANCLRVIPVAPSIIHPPAFVMFKFPSEKLSLRERIEQHKQYENLRMRVKDSQCMLYNPTLFWNDYRVKQYRVEYSLEQAPGSSL